MGTATFSKPVSVELELQDVTSQLTFASNVTYVSGGVYIYGGYVYIQLRITAKAAIARNTDIITAGMPNVYDFGEGSVSSLAYLEAINRASITDRKRCYTSVSINGKIRVSNISNNDLVSGETYVIRGFYPLALGG